MCIGGWKSRLSTPGLTMGVPSESARKTMEAMAFCADAPRDLTTDILDALIEWTATGKAPAPEVASRGDLLHALYRQRLALSMA